jgi:hypothetical protein
VSVYLTHAIRQDELKDLDARDKLTAESLRPRKRPRGGGAGGQDRDERSDEEDESLDYGEYDDEEQSSSEEEEEEEEERCFTCTHQTALGHTCAGGQAHARCGMPHCREPFPFYEEEELRSNSSLPIQTCDGCNTLICGRYFHWCERPVLPEDTRLLKCWARAARLEEIELEDLPPEVFRWNQEERTILLEMMRDANMTATQLFRHCILGNVCVCECVCVCLCVYLSECVFVWVGVFVTCICTYEYIYILCTYKHTHMLTYTYIHTCPYTQTRIHIYTHAHMHSCSRTHVYAHIQTHIHTYIRTYIHAYIHTYMHTYIHTYIHPL